MTTENKTNTQHTNETNCFETELKNMLSNVSEEFIAFFNSDEYERCEEEASKTSYVITAEKFASDIKLLEMVRRSKVLKRTKTGLVRGALHDLTNMLLLLTDYLESLQNIVQG